jgi:hypothetical protein
MADAGSLNLPDLAVVRVRPPSRAPALTCVIVTGSRGGEDQIGTLVSFAVSIRRFPRAPHILGCPTCVSQLGPAARCARLWRRCPGAVGMLGCRSRPELPTRSAPPTGLHPGVGRHGSTRQRDLLVRARRMVADAPADALIALGGRPNQLIGHCPVSPRGHHPPGPHARRRRRARPDRMPVAPRTPPRAGTATSNRSGDDSVSCVPSRSTVSACAAQPGHAAGRATCSRSSTTLAVWSRPRR